MLIDNAEVEATSLETMGGPRGGRQCQVHVHIGPCAQGRRDGRGKKRFLLLGGNWTNLNASSMPPAPWLAVCSEAASASNTISYRVCTKHGTRSGNLCSRFGTRSGTRSVLFRVLIRDLIAGLVPDRRPDLVQDLGQDLSDRSGTRFGIRDLVRLESDLASDQVPDLAPDQVPHLVQGLAPDFVRIRANSVRNVVPVGCQTW